MVVELEAVLRYYYLDGREAYGLRQVRELLMTARPKAAVRTRSKIDGSGVGVF
jgi:hypothetical protein